MKQASRDFFEGLGYLSYAIAYADGHVDASENEEFGKALLNAFGRWQTGTVGQRAVAAFEIALSQKLSSEISIDKAMEIFKDCKTDVAENKNIMIELFEEVANSDRDFSDDEKDIIELIKKEMSEL